MSLAAEEYQDKVCVIRKLEAARAEIKALRAAIYSASNDLVNATYEDRTDHIKTHVHFALNKLVDVVNGD